MIFGVWLECTLQWEWQQSGFGVYTPSWSVHSVRVRDSFREVTCVHITSRPATDAADIVSGK